MRIEARHVTRRLLLIMAVPTVALAIAGFWDLRWLLVALMILLVIIPQAVVLTYFSKLLRPEAREALALQQLTVTPGADITIYYLDPDSGAPAGTPRRIAWNDIKSVGRTGRLLVILTADSSRIPVPTEAADPSLTGALTAVNERDYIYHEPA